MQTASLTNSGRVTFTLSTPWGKTLPAPALECAEVAIFLRITFASWFNLPFFLEAADAEGRIYFGHFGMRRAQGRFARTPDFATRYPDHSDRAYDVAHGGAWPEDAELKAKKIPGSYDDAQPMIGANAHTGAYFDQLFLNKRVGHFLITTLAYYGSVHLADTRNTYNLSPEAILPGDLLVERWQSRGIGHVLLVMRARQAGLIDNAPRMEAELASGSMPRRQPVWETPGASKRTFTNNYTGGPGYVQFGGGLKRWRIAKAINGRWTNVVPTAERTSWLNSADSDALAARVQRFRDLLVELSPEQKRDVLLEIIEQKRDHLRRYPASCSARIAREDAFDGLYELMQGSFGKDRAQVDRTYRILEDYVFAELDYGTSKTCCWNSSTAEMFDIIMDLNLEHQQQANMCADVIVFKNRDDAGDGYDTFRQYATQTGRAQQWRAWRADESCPQSGVAEDTEADAPLLTPYCDGRTPPVSGDDTYDFVNAPVSIPDNHPPGLTLMLEVPARDTPSEVHLDVEIRHTWRGDLQLELVNPSGQSEVIFDRQGSSEDDVVERFDLSDTFANRPVAGTWTLIVRDLASQDTGSVQRATLTLE